MSCAHCLFSCTEKGKDMSMGVFKDSIKIAKEYDSYITIGGGEPTLHPKILEMVGYSALMLDGAPTMITNGSCSEDVWETLFSASLKGILSLHVSRSPWHDELMVNGSVWRDADRHNMWWGDPSSSHRGITPKGRAKGNISKLTQDAVDFGFDPKKVFETHDCQGVRVDPYGKVWADLKKENVLCGYQNDENVCKAYELIEQDEE